MQITVDFKLRCFFTDWWSWSLQGVKFGKFFFALKKVSVGTYVSANNLVHYWHCSLIV